MKKLMLILVLALSVVVSQTTFAQEKPAEQKVEKVTKKTPTKAKKTTKKMKKTTKKAAKVSKKTVTETKKEAGK